jgi:hypothetical protein
VMDIHTVTGMPRGEARALSREDRPRRRLADP